MKRILAAVLGTALLLGAVAFLTGQIGVPAPPSPQQVRLRDATGTALAPVSTAAPAGTEAGLYVRVVSQPAGGASVTADQGAPNTQANRWPVFWTDGAAERGTASLPLRVDPTGTTTQPVSGTVTANQAGTWTVQQGTPPWSVSGSGTFTVAGTVTGNQGSPASQANRWPTMLSDGSAFLGTGGTGTGLTVTCTNCGGAVEGQTYMAAVFSSAAAANKDHLNLFNAAGSGKVLKVLSITVAPQLAAAITGLVQSFLIQTSSTAGATCTAQTIRAEDSNNAAVPAQVTASTNCTTDPTSSFDWLVCSQGGEEGSVATHSSSLDGNCYKHHANGGQPKTLREGQGLSIRSGALSGAWPVHAHIRFTM